jgi:hypothetical protein
MSIVPVRNLAQYGIITDVDSYDLPSTAWSQGVNVRFRNRKIERGPIHRTVDTLQDNPRYMAVSTPTSGFDTLFIAYKNGRIYEWDNGTETNRSLAGYVDSDSEGIYTSTFLSDVFYVNREDRVPWAYGPAAVAFTALTGWDATHRAKLLKAVSGALVALNVTQGATAYPTMVKTSSFALAGAEPASWDHTDLSTNATENTLAEMEGAIIDANNFKGGLCIYSRGETWFMALDPGSEDIWDYRRLFDDAGSINTNCSIEVDGKHYVFGVDDIWRHDGVTKESICEERTRDFIFRGLNYQATGRCFVFHDGPKSELQFFYVSDDALVAFPADLTKGCNRSAVFNLVNETWAFDDHPYVWNADLANVDASETYATVTATYETIGGSYADQEDGLEKVAVMISEMDDPILSAFDNIGPQSVVAFPSYEAGNTAALLVREGIDLDEVGKELRGYAIMDSLYPQGRFDTVGAMIEFAFGSSDYSNQALIWSDWQTFDGDTLYKLDYRSAGRFLAMKVRQTTIDWFSLSGFDFDVDVVSDR